ncbi:hypothetical protein M378DRAFT_81501 [Amanita muscaria Koide BX008]|uniref:Guanine nucleotide-binding protein alpha-4 subunit n=1 Tax=Amanita muscaria (strain Koide BX008) TaxID=946122 RepID=A0A0C2T6M3_AMAMK|nr:hypothetical protein M378DRAFT_81501 [Amanita muscaria Koide BX008]
MSALKQPRKATSTWPPHPPMDESEEESRVRLEQEAEAKRVSDNIDRALAVEREQLKKKESGAKILLLGQAESGKSTVLKNFQLHLSPRAFEADAALWCPVIHLNLARSVNFVLNTLNKSLESGRNSTTEYLRKLDGLRRYFIRLAPLRQVEESLTQKIFGSTLPYPDGRTAPYHPSRASEVELRSGSGWKGLFKVKRQIDTSMTEPNRRILAACADDILNLWSDPFVQACLKAQNIILEDQPGFFVEDVRRVTEEGYKPISADILRARVATIGPEEHLIQVEGGTDTTDWTIYDVGAAWAQFFDDVNVIIFLAPISAFNQNLDEDESVNRLVDSMRLWEQICSNKILASVELILFLNKQDILDAKLKAGIRFAKYITAYGNRINDTKNISRYLQEAFAALHQQNSPQKRRLHSHLTCAIDTHATATVIKQLREHIVVKLLASSNII